MTYITFRLTVVTAPHRPVFLEIPLKRPSASAVPREPDFFLYVKEVKWFPPLLFLRHCIRRTLLFPPEFKEVVPGPKGIELLCSAPAPGKKGRETAEVPPAKGTV